MHTSVCDIKQKSNKQANKRINMDNRLMVIRGEGGWGRVKWVKGINIW